MYTKQTPIRDVIEDSLFENYGQLLFPVNPGYMNGSTLGDFSLTWYNNINPDKTVEIVQFLHDQKENGYTIFYDIYSEEEKQRDARKRNTGLFFFPGKEKVPTAIVNAGLRM
jgi:hypothetical protein